MKYEEVKEDEWVRPIIEGYKMSCCDCGLVHKLDFKIEDGRIWLKATRDYRATAAVRREMKKHNK
jgi:hypothetical protein